MSNEIWFGVHVMQNGLDFETVKDLCLKAEKLGFDLFTVMDHFMSSRTHKHPIECWTTLAGLAALTDKIKIGPLVSCYSYRRPTVLAKMATTIDIISNGRLIFGIGAGWDEAEFKSYMGRFPLVQERMRGLEEAVEICKGMFTNKQYNYNGKIYQVNKIINSPPPVQRPIPIMIGGGGEKLTLRIAAKYGDISHVLSTGNLKNDVRKFSVLKKHCEAIGRNYEDIVKGTGFFICIDSSAQKAYSKAKRYARKMKWKPEFFRQWIKTRLPTMGAPGNFVETFNNYIDKGITLFTCMFFDLIDIQLFSEEVIPNVS